MLSLWQIGVEETRELLDEGWHPKPAPSPGGRNK